MFPLKSTIIGFFPEFKLFRTSTAFAGPDGGVGSGGGGSHSNSLQGHPAEQFSLNIREHMNHMKGNEMKLPRKDS